MNLEGIAVKHKVFGKGMIKQHEDNYILITFSQGDKKFKYPSVFKSFIKAIDSNMANVIQKDIERVEAEHIAEQNKKMLASTEVNINYENIPTTQKHNSGVFKTCKELIDRQYFFVFQNKSFDAERRGGYLWAPKSNKDGRKVSHWLMMEKVHKGDIIFHSVNKNILAISIAQSDCYSAIQPEELKREQMWEDDGYKVDCQYIDIQNPIVTSDYMDIILELQPSKYAPFNNLGRGNTGYLFASNIELSQFLWDKLTIKNKYIEKDLI